MNKREQFKLTDEKLFTSFYQVLVNASSFVTIDQVCKNAGVHRETFYKHFASKDDFVFAFINWAFERFIEKTKNMTPYDTFVAACGEMDKAKDGYNVLKNQEFIDEAMNRKVKDYFVSRFTNLTHSYSDAVFIVGGIRSLLSAYIHKETTLEEAIKSYTKFITPFINNN